jgi:hypothetical protein
MMYAIHGSMTENEFEEAAALTNPLVRGGGGGRRRAEPTLPRHQTPRLRPRARAHRGHVHGALQAPPPPDALPRLHRPPLPPRRLAPPLPSPNVATATVRRSCGARDPVSGYHGFHVAGGEGLSGSGTPRCARSRGRCTLRRGESTRQQVQWRRAARRRQSPVWLLTAEHR